ncbi:MAG: transporter ATP-binding protein [Clostridiales bacterium]|jgi:ATP-binding cassette subfamily B protein|nr:transporter ATP-binding protein [Clostridiales bacterium]
MIKICGRGLIRMARLIKYLSKFNKQLFIGSIFKLIEAVFELIVPLVMAKIIDVGVKNKDIGYVIKMGGVMIALGILGFLCALICQYYAAKASQGFGTIIRNELFRHINKLSHSDIDKFGTPTLITRLTNDVNQLQLAVAMLVRLVTRAPFLAIGALVMAIILDIKLALIFLTVIPIIVLILYFVMSKSVPFYRVIQKKLDRVSLITRENLDGARVIRSLSKEEAELNRFEIASDDVAQTAVKVGKLEALLNPLTFMVLNAGIIAIIWFGGGRVYEGSLSQGKIIAFVNYMTQISLMLVIIANLVVIFTKAAASASRVIEVFETKTSIEEINNNTIQIHEDINQPKIEFKNVSFSYEGSEEYSIEGLSIKINKGETIGIIGGTGSGKSTIVNLIPRFYDVSTGEVLIDGINVKDYSFEQIRMQIGVVPQRAVLFTGTILENMRWRDEKATTEEINKALEIAQATEFINKLPEGLNKMINQGGKNLSGGQKQRLTIARALVGNPQILILDDSASALDYATDASLRHAIKDETKGMTVLMVSQRASTVKNADRIIVLEDGKVAGIGTHNELLDTCEVYREICLSQLSSEEVKR